MPGEYTIYQGNRKGKNTRVIGYFRFDYQTEEKGLATIEVLKMYVARYQSAAFTGYQICAYTAQDRSTRLGKTGCRNSGFPVFNTLEEANSYLAQILALEKNGVIDLRLMSDFEGIH